jgi:hypothetical protein
MMLGGSCEDPNLLNPYPNIGDLVNPDPNPDNQKMKNFLSKILTNLIKNYNILSSTQEASNPSYKTAITSKHEISHPNPGSIQIQFGNNACQLNVLNAAACVKFSLYINVLVKHSKLTHTE